MTVVHVVRPVAPILPVPGGSLAGPAAMDDRVLAESQESVRRDAEADVAVVVRQLPGRATTRVVTGDPAMELCRIAEEERFDLIVVGSHGSGFLKRVLLGSVSHHVLHHAPCPVLVVRETTEDEDGER